MDLQKGITDKAVKCKKAYSEYMWLNVWFSTTGFFLIYSLVEKGRLQVCLMEVTEIKSDKEKM